MEANKHEASASSADQRLGTAPLTPLIFKLALPTALAQLVNMLYNIVDRIYVGHIPETGSLALAGLGANESGSPPRRPAISAGISFPVTSRAAFNISKFENPVDEPKLNASDGLPSRK